MSMRDPAANTLIAEHGGEKAASAFAWYQTARTVANSISRAVAGILLTITAANYPLVFFIAFALSVLPLVVVLLFVKEERTAPHAAPVPETATPTPPAKRPSVIPFVGLGFLIAGTAEMLNGLFPILATEYAGLSKAQAGLVYSISTIAAICSGPVFGWLSDHVSRKLVLGLRSVANTVSSLLYWVMPSFLGIGLAKTADDMGKAAFRPAWGALMAQAAAHDKSTRARTISWLSMGEDAGGVAAPMLAGFLWSTWGIGALMSVRIVMAVITEVYAWTISRPRRARPAFSKKKFLETEVPGSSLQTHSRPPSTLTANHTA
jgi:MFS family permease